MSDILFIIVHFSEKISQNFLDIAAFRIKFCFLLLILQVYQDGVPQKLTMNGSENLPNSYDYDLIIIGGGSGGLAAAKARSLRDLGSAYGSPLS